MQDIVLRKPKHPLKVPDKPSIEPFAPPAIKKSEGLFLVMEVVFESAGKLGNWIIAKLGNSYTPDIVQEAQTTPIQAVKEVKHPEKEEPKKPESTKRRPHLKETLKKGFQKSKTALRTPHGKTTAIQAILMAGLFIYVGSLRGNNQYFQARNVGETAQNTSLHLFLPSASDYVQPKPFEENEASFQASQLPLHAWLTPWNLDQLKDNLPSYSSISAFWLQVQPDGASFQPKTDWQTWQDFRQNKALENKHTYLTVTGDPEYIAPMLNDPRIQETHILNLLQAVKSQGFDGIDIDYEGLGRENRDLFTEFIRNLSDQFHKEKKLVSVTVEARIANQVPMDWRSLGRLSDEVRLMVYDYHAKETNFPGPITPLGWLKETLDYAQQNLKSQKLIIGLGNYGYDWTEPSEEGQSWKGVGISFDQAAATATEKNSPIIRANGIDDRGYDIGSTPTYSYKDEENRQHTVWFEDAASLQAKVNLIKQYSTAGVIFWSVGLGDKNFWQSSNIPN